MRLRLWILGWLACQAIGAQPRPLMEVRCKLELVDADQSSSAMDSAVVSIQAVDRVLRLTGRADAAGNALLRKVPEGRYSIDLAFAGRIISFSAGSADLNPLDFELKEGAAGPLRIVVSLKTADLSIQINDLPDPLTPGAFLAILAPADPYLTLHRANAVYAVPEQQIKVPAMIPGKYLLFVVEAGFSNDLGRAAVRQALQDRATPLEVLANGDTEITAAAIDSDTVRHAIEQAGPSAP